MKKNVVVYSMANDNVVVDDDTSEIVTKFLLNTCRLLQPTKHHIVAARWCSRIRSLHPVDNDEAGAIPLTTGSVAEFYIQPMLSCIGDVDVMFHRSDYLAIPYRHPLPTHLPSDFSSRVTVFEIVDSGYPGYVYLVRSYILIENSDACQYNAVPYDWRSNNGRIAYASYDAPHGPAQTMHGGTFSVDAVTCTRCLSWPPQADYWPTRHRNYGWPDSATVDLVVSNGCDVVQVAHRHCREWMRKSQLRLSFSRAEIVLLNSWTPVQQLIYHMLRVFMKTERLTDSANKNTTERKMLSNYHIKTLTLWTCELKPRSWWIDDLNIVRNCVELLHMLADWLTNKNCPHYFVNSCSLIDTSSHVEMISIQLASITEPWLSKWFVNNYIRQCAQICPDRVSRLFGDISTNIKLQEAVSAIVDCRSNSALRDAFAVCSSAEFFVARSVWKFSLTSESSEYWMTKLATIDFCLCDYFTAVAFQYISSRISQNRFNDELLNVLATLVGQFVGKRRYCHQLGSILSMSQATKLIKVIGNDLHNTLQLIDIELAKAYLYRVLRCKDSDSDSFCCLANVYLAVLYYVTGQYHMVIDYCTMVTRSQHHLQCSSHVAQGEILPKIDDNIDIALGLAVLYQCLRAAATNQQRIQDVSVFTTTLFAHNLNCISVAICCQLTQALSNNEVQRYTKSIVEAEKPFITDLLLLKSLKMLSKGQLHYKPRSEQCQTRNRITTELDTSKLGELLQRSAVEHFTTFRHLQSQHYSTVATIVTTECKALYAYKRGEYRQCLQLSSENVHTLLNTNHLLNSFALLAFIELLNDDIVSLTALTLMVNPACREDSNCNVVTQRDLSLYLMIQCQLKLRHSMTSISKTLHYIEIAQRRLPAFRTLDQLTLKLCERKAAFYLASIMQL